MPDDPQTYRKLTLAADHATQTGRRGLYVHAERDVGVLGLAANRYGFSTGSISNLWFDPFASDAWKMRMFRNRSAFRYHCRRGSGILQPRITLVTDLR